MKKQQGFLVMIAVVLIAVFGVIGMVAAYLVSTNNLSSSQALAATQAFYLAESGVEKSLHALSTGTTCNNVGTTFSLGTGSITTTGSLSHALCTITSSGNIMGSSRAIQIITQITPLEEGWVLDEPPILHWNTPVANQWNNIASIPYAAGVSTISATDAWLVTSISWIYHWDGANWNFVSKGGPGLQSVYCNNANDCWAVGNGGTHIHWNGSGWSNNRGSGNTVYQSVACVNSSNCVAVGTINNFQNPSQQPLVYSVWNGNSWSGPNFLNTRKMGGLNHYNIACSSSNTCWIAGDNGSFIIGQFINSAWQWSTQSLWSFNVPSTNYYSISCPASNNCWAVGNRFPRASIWKPAIIHWNGNTWTQVDAPNPNVSDSVILKSVSCSSANSCWAVGSLGSGSLGVIDHWDGNSWSNIATPNRIPTLVNMIGSNHSLADATTWSAYFP